MKKQIFSLALALIFTLSMLSTLAFAEQRGNTAVNNALGGTVGRSGNWIYYAATEVTGDMNKNYEYKLYKVRNDGSGLTIVADGVSSNINILNDTIYFTASGESGIFKMDMDGKNRKRLNSEVSYNASVIDDMIYFMAKANPEDRWDYSGYIYSMTTDGKEKKRLSNDTAEDFGVTGGWIYYINATDEKIYKMTTDGNKKTKLSDDKVSTIGGIQVTTSRIYYTDEKENLYSMDLNGKNKRLVLDKEVWSFAVVGSKIYYTTNINNSRGSNKGLFSVDMRLDNYMNKPEHLTDDFSSILGVAGDWIFYINMGHRFYTYKIRTDGSDKQAADQIMDY